MSKTTSATAKIPLYVALIPVFFLIIFLALNVLEAFGDDAVSGANQWILMMSAALAALIGVMRGTKLKLIIDGMADNIKETTKAIIILLLIGALSGTWLISGVVPSMVYYGLQILNPTFFLAASLVICAIVSLATGSSWGTTATMGLALIGIGETMEMSKAMVAGAVISGAYFGDKLSPMSDTTNLAAAMAGTDLFTHIRYMLYTTVPSVLIALLIFTITGFGFDGNIGDDTAIVEQGLKAKFTITPWLLLVPVAVIGLIAFKVDALVALLAGVLLACPFAYVFQPDIVKELGSGFQGQATETDFFESYNVIINSMVEGTSISSDVAILESVFSAKGVAGMLGTIWLIISAMMFGGAMQATGFLQRIATAIVSLAKSTGSLIASTLATTGLINVTASDQFLALVVPGRMFKEVYEKRGLAPENLSRTLEDGGTVTSPLIPYNTCGAYQSATLGVATGDYWLYCFFNLISPLMSLAYGIFGIKIKYLPAKEEKSSKS